GRSRHHRRVARRGQFRGGCFVDLGCEASGYAAYAREVVEGDEFREARMIAQAFEYTAPKTLDEALGLLAEGAKPLAGGMSLIPMMKLRLAAPEHLVDLARIKDLNYIREAGGMLHIGATVTHHEVESSALISGKCPLLAETASHIGDVQVRNMGTIGGSVAHADPSA